MLSATKLKSEVTESQGNIKLEEGISISGFEKISDISAEWKRLTKDLSIFFSYEFLSVVEACPPSGLENRYVVAYKDGKEYGILCCQLQSFQGNESIKFKDKKGLSNRWGNSIKKGFSKLLKFEGIVCGSVMLTGNYAFRFFDGKLSYKDGFLLAEQIIEFYRQQLNKEGHNITVTFLKDFYDDKKFESHSITGSKYKEFSVQPNMILKVKPDWNQYSDYLASFQSKYRVREKRARKKLQGIERREFDYVDIRKYNTDIYRLYRNIVDKINFNLFFLHEDYFAELKKQLKDKMKLYGYFKGDELVAFYTCIDNGEEMNAHFLGYNPDENRAHQLYLNSLYDMVEISLKYKFKTINFSRTAMEIKSSVGSEPHEMYCYLKHQNQIMNLGVAKIVGALNPTEDWIQRRPFRV